MAYEIWDGSSGNLLMERPTKNEALAAVREIIDLRGEAYIEPFALILEDDDGESQMIAQGKELAALAFASRFRPLRSA